MKKTLALLLLLAGLSVEAQAKDLVWNGSPGHMTWDLNDRNWFERLYPENTCRFEQGAYVHFGDTGSGVVTLDGEFSTRRVYMDNKAGHDYTFTGEGKLVGDELALQKEGDGTLTITTANTFSSISIIGGTVVVDNEMALGSSRIAMYNYGGGTPTLDLGKYSISNSVVVDNSYARIGNGTLSGDLTLQKTSHLTLLDDTDITGNISLGDGASFNLADNSVTGAVTLAGSATIGNGTVEGNLTVAVGKSLALLANTTVTGGVSLGAQSSLNLGGNTFHTGGDACNRVTFSGGTTVSNGTLVLDSDWSPGYALTFTGITLDLNKHTLSKAVNLVGDNAIGNGTLNTHLNVGEGNTLTLCGNLDGQQNQDDKIILGNNATLDLNNHSISKYCYVRINGDAFIGNGSFYSEVVVEADKKLTLCGNLWSSGWYMGNIILGDKGTLDLGKHTYSGLLSVKGDSATIGNGTLERDLSVGDGKTLNLCGDLGGSGTISMSGSATLNIGTHTLSKNVTLNGTSTIKAEHTTIKALNTDKEGLLKELSVTDGLIAGTDRQASLADGLDINRMGYDLTLENLVLTANNKISVGDGHTITLNNVTIKLSQAHYDEPEGVFLFDLGTLINCDLVMKNVLLDASDLSLPEGFDPATTSVVFDFGDDVTIKQATGLDMRLGNYWSTSLNLNQQGQVIFTKLVETPEPATGTLSLLALAALAFRRRRK